MADELQLILYASQDTSSFMTPGLSNYTCPFVRVLQKRKLFTPFGSFGVTAFVSCAIPFVCTLGIIGNIVTFIIIKESSSRIPGHFYIMMLTIFDSLSLLCLLPAMWTVLIMRPFYHHLDPYSYTWADHVSSAWGWCQVRLILTFFTRTLSIYTIVLFTLERCIKVIWPFQTQRIGTVSNAKKSVFVLFLFSVAVNLPYIFAFEKFKVPCSGGKTVCKTTEVFFRIRYFKMFLLSVLPSFIIIVCNSIILVKMRQSSSNIYRHHKEHCLSDNGVEHDHHAEKKQNREITQRLLLISFAFFFLNMPLFIVTSIHNHSELTKQKYHLRGAWADVFYISLLLFVINLGINFILYCFTGRVFRMAALSLCRCKWKDMKTYRSALSVHRARRSSSANTKSTIISRSESTRSGKSLITTSKSRETEV